MDNKKVNFIRINHKNNIEYFTEEKLIEFKLNLFNKLQEIQELDFSNNLNSFMEKIIPNFSDDKLELNYKLSKLFYDNNPKIKFDRKCPEILLIIEKILNYNFNMVFKCSETLINFLSRILFFCFKEMKLNPKLYLYKKFEDFKNKTNDFIFQDIYLEEYISITKMYTSRKKSNSSVKIVHSFAENLDNLNNSCINKINFLEKGKNFGKKSSSKSITDSIDTITKKSTFSSANNMNCDGCNHLRNLDELDNLSHKEINLNGCENERFNLENKEKLNLNSYCDKNYKENNIRNNNNKVCNFTKSVISMLNFVTPEKQYKRSSCEELNNKLVIEKLEEIVHLNNKRFTNEKIKNTPNNFSYSNNNAILNSDIETKKNDCSSKSSTNKKLFEINSNKKNVDFSNSSDFFKNHFPNYTNTDNTIFLENKDEKKFYSYGIPIYLVLLIQKFQSIKKLIISFPKNFEKENLYEKYAIFFLNVDWLFKNLIEIEIDFGQGTKKKFDNLFKIKEIEEKSSLIYGKKFINIIEENKFFFDLILLICNLCSKKSKLYLLTLTNYSSFFFELDYLTKTYYPMLKGIHLLDIFNNFIKLVKLNINSNSLDMLSLDRFINLIQINNRLNCIKFDLIIKGEDFSKKSLKQQYLKNYLYSCLPNLKNIPYKPNDLNDTVDLYKNNILDEIEEYDENKFIEIMIKKFEPLLEEFFFMIESKNNLTELIININLPNIISGNEKFILTLQKFFFNILKSLDNNFCNLNSLNIKSPYFSFDNRKYPVIEKFISTIDLQNNNISLKEFSLNIQINKIPNILNLIPKNVIILFLGELDIATFSSLKKNYLEKDLFKNSKLEIFKISFCPSILEKNLLAEEFKFIYNLEKPISLKEIQIYTNLIITKKFLKEIINDVKGDNLEKYYFEFNKLSLENLNYFKSNLQKINLKDDKDKINEKKINYFFNIIRKSREDINNLISRKVLYNIVKFISSIYLTNIEIKFKE